MDVIEKVVGFLLLLAIFGVVLAFPTMWLWNGTLVPVLGVKIITAWQALGLVVLGRILIGNT